VIAKESGASVYGTARVRDVERGMLNLPIGDVLDLADASTAHRMLDGAPHQARKDRAEGRRLIAALKSACTSVRITHGRS